MAAMNSLRLTVQRWRVRGLERPLARLRELDARLRAALAAASFKMLDQVELFLRKIRSIGGYLSRQDCVPNIVSTFH
jgi:hypothetical protein